MKVWYVYVIRNRNNVLYTGIAKDMERRLAEHNGGGGAKFTRGRGPWTLIHGEGPMSHGDALRREIQIKKDRALKKTLKAD